MLDLFKIVALILVVVAAINLGIVGLLGFDVLGSIFGGMGMLYKVLHILIGVSGLFMLFGLKDHLKK